MSIYLTIILGLLIFYIIDKICSLTIFKFIDSFYNIFKYTWIINMVLTLINVVNSFILSYIIFNKFLSKFII